MGKKVGQLGVYRVHMASRNERDRSGRFDDWVAWSFQQTWRYLDDTNAQLSVSFCLLDHECGTMRPAVESCQRLSQAVRTGDSSEWHNELHRELWSGTGNEL